MVASVFPSFIYWGFSGLPLLSVSLFFFPFLSFYTFLLLLYQFIVVLPLYLSPSFVSRFSVSIPFLHFSPFPRSLLFSCSLYSSINPTSRSLRLPTDLLSSSFPSFVPIPPSSTLSYLPNIRFARPPLISLSPSPPLSPPILRPGFSRTKGRLASDPAEG